ncbi:MAG: 50S ribosomal protein L6 [archaeon]
MKETLKKELELPEGVTASLDGKVLIVKGPKGENQRDFAHPRLEVTIEGNKIMLNTINATKREKKIIGTYAAHINNLIRGVQEKFGYDLKICSGHFPMNVSVSGSKFIIKNFLGEKHPREIQFPQEVQVKVNGEIVEVKSCSRELAGQVAAKIEQMCRITNRDRRIFQDGVYITKKPRYSD